MRDIHQTLENIVYLELLRRGGYQVRVGKAGDREIDSVSVRANEKLYIQVTYILATEETVEREFSVFESVKDNYPKYVVSMDEMDRGRNGIKNIHIREFLLMDNYA